MSLLRHLLSPAYRNGYGGAFNRQHKLVTLGMCDIVCAGSTGTCNRMITTLPTMALPTANLSLLQPYYITHSTGSFSSSTDSEMTDEEIKRAMGSISEKFVEAMELMGDARESVGTVYFSDDVTDTQAQVEETLADYNALLSRLNDVQKKTVIQSIGLKMEELKAQVGLLEDLIKECD